MGGVYVLANTRVTVSRETLQTIAGLLGITTKAHLDRILTDGLVIVKAPSQPAGGGPRRQARARGSRSSTEGGTSTTRSRTSRQRT
jgi:hypothetical protein